MQETKIWEVIPKSEPVVIKNCPKCGGRAIFENSGKFRVNANQNKLDVWLIYQCRKCKATWNMTLLTRVNPKEIDETLYKKFLSNNRELAKMYAFDVDMHMHNKSLLNYEEIEYDVVGEDIQLGELKEEVNVILKCKYPFNIRIDKILSDKLNISREKIKKFVKEGQISSKAEKNIAKAKLKREIRLKIG